MNCDASQFMDFVYPSLFKLDPENEAWGKVDEATGFVSKPAYCFLSASAMELSGVYLLTGWMGCDWRGCLTVGW